MALFVTEFKRASLTMQVGDKSFDVNRRDLPMSSSCLAVCLAAVRRRGYTVVHHHQHEETPRVRYSNEYWTISMPLPSLWQRLFARN
jgi:hypothetical protein